MPKLESVNPILAVHDVETSIAYYMEKLGFTSCWGWEQPPTFGGVRRDGIEIFFCQDCQGNPGTWMSVWVDDVDVLYAEFKARGADIRQPPTNFPWGVREMNVSDPDGHRLRFSMATDQPDDGIPLPRS
jgi:predicted enzyme related to lactoylglutathione lyase